MSMSKASKAATMSAFLCPGAGFFVVKQKVLGSIVVLITLMNTTVIFSIIMATVEYRLNQLMSELKSVSHHLASDLTAGLPDSDAFTLQINLLILSILWIYSTADCWRRGRIIDRVEKIRKIKQTKTSTHFR